MSTQPPAPGQSQVPDPGTMRCPRCSSPVGRDQDWCLECGAPARTRLAPTPNWQLPTVAIGAIVVLAGALLAFAFVKLTSDDATAPAGTTPSAVVETSPPAAAAPPVATATQTVTTTAPAGPAVPSTVPGQTATTTRSRTTTAAQPATTTTTRSRTSTASQPATTGTTSAGGEP